MSPPPQQFRKVSATVANTLVVATLNVMSFVQDVYYVTKLVHFYESVVKSQLSLAVWR
jgi:hypothetical protein